MAGFNYYGSKLEKLFTSHSPVVHYLSFAIPRSQLLRAYTYMNSMSYYEGSGIKDSSSIVAYGGD